MATGYFDIHYITPVKIRTVLAEYAQIWKKVPGFSQLVDPGFYTWILLLRYALPLMACTPLLIYLTVREEKESETEGENRPL